LRSPKDGNNQEDDMKRRFGIAAALFAASLTLTSAAQASDSLVGALLGAGAGVVVGQAVGGRDGAIVGGGLGAIAGAAIASEHWRSREVHAPARHAYYEEPVAIPRRDVRYVERVRNREDGDWEDRRWDHRDDRPWRGWRERRGERCWRD
jgi:hypothetical protein